MAKRGRAALTICSTAFITLGRAQASALGYAKLPIAVIQHPFGIRTRDEVRAMADKCATEVVRLLSEGTAK
ncbi:MAG: hypothetical protein NTW47_16440 [Proteobacteria bacterium]|nr:hypothetical protein [Pseudomonadota bacterium]